MPTLAEYKKLVLTLAAALEPFTTLCPWLKPGTETGPDGEIWGVRDEDELLLGEPGQCCFISDFVTAGMIRQARLALAMCQGETGD